MKRILSTIIIFFACARLLAQQPELILPLGHTEIVRYAGFSPDGKYVITGGADQLVNIWEAFSGKKIKTLDGFPSDINYSFFSPGGNYLAIGTDSTVSVWDFPGFRKLGQFNDIRRTFFSADNRHLFLLGYDGSVFHYALPSLDLVMKFEDQVLFGHDMNWRYQRVDISPDSRLFVTSGDSLVRVREIVGGNIIFEDQVRGSIASFFSADGADLILVSGSGISRIPLARPQDKEQISHEDIKYAVMSRNHRFLLVMTDYSIDSRATFWDLKNYRTVYRSDDIRSVADTFYVYGEEGKAPEIKTGEAAYSFPTRVFYSTFVNIDDQGKYIQGSYYVWNNADPRQSSLILENYVPKSAFSPDGRYLIIQQQEGNASLYDLSLKKIVQTYDTRADILEETVISPDGKRFVITGKTNQARLCDVTTGRIIAILKHRGKIGSVMFSKDGARILTNSMDSTARIWDGNTGRLVKSYRNQHASTNPAYFGPGGSVILTKSSYDSIPVYDIDDPEKIVKWEIRAREYPSSNLHNYIIRSSPSGRIRLSSDMNWNTILETSEGREIFKIGYSYSGHTHLFSDNDSLLVLTGDMTDSIWVFDITKKEWIHSVSLGVVRDRYGYIKIEQMQFSPDNRFLLVSDMNEVLHVLSTSDFKEVFTLPGRKFSMSDDGKFLATIHQGKFHLYDFTRKELLYSYVSLDSINYLLVDAKKRYDGTEAARKGLYFSCGKEIVELDQFKDRLWVPNLAERTLSGDSIYAQGLQDLQICGYTPQVEEKRGLGSLEFLIRPGKGGLGETVLYINGIELKRYKTSELIPVDTAYVLKLDDQLLKDYFTSGMENTISLRAFTQDNTISSRGIIIKDTTMRSGRASPNLYAVMVGVSDYKGEGLDLKYAAKDASDLSAAISAAAGKLLNTDGKEHIFLYKLTTGPDRFRLPEKEAIRKTLEEIGKLASPNDILLIFFAGHGVMYGESKQFYFLTSEAHTAAGDADPGEVGISTAELTDWIKPASLKAQKRILIIDACNSGQAIKDIVKIGREDQGYTAARNDDRGQQVKLIEKLNERSGFTILSASASNQNAYEMGLYAQGLLTYALLKTVKEQPDILTHGKFLDVVRWFQASGNTVESLLEKDRMRQEPQIVSNTNFVIGVVDNEVKAAIKLPVEKLVFGSSIVFNSKENSDNLKLSRLINAELANMSSAPAGSRILYISDTDAPGSYFLSGSYTVQGKQVALQVQLRQNEKVTNKFNVTGSTDNLNELALKLRAYLEKLFK